MNTEKKIDKNSLKLANILQNELHSYMEKIYGKNIDIDIFLNVAERAIFTLYLHKVKQICESLDQNAKIIFIDETIKRMKNRLYHIGDINCQTETFN